VVRPATTASKPANSPKDLTRANAVTPAVGLENGALRGTLCSVVKVNLSAAPLADEPAVVVTVMLTVAAAWSGVVAVMELEELTVIEVAALNPKPTADAPAKLVPVMVTLVPPDVGPDVGLTEVTVGTEVAAGTTGTVGVVVVGTAGTAGTVAAA
jgi:hypothetical protein